MKNLCFDFRLKSIDCKCYAFGNFAFFRLRKPDFLQQEYCKSTRQDCFDHDFVIDEVTIEISHYETTYVKILACKKELTGYGKIFSLYITTGDLLVLNEEQIHE